MEFLEDDEELYKVAKVFNLTPWEYFDTGGLKGKNYPLLSKFLKWNKLKQKMWLPVLIEMQNLWIETKSKK